ncbi:ATPase, T2SS/T4P/T4SS family [Bacillus sp. JCM 19034]|uniref:ATPase, T2SS/T4P/T4SS family n=1 Tax=Bacillus sp. JCM 19034 TaxID=1481928 RepID=UPI000782EBB1|nr:ATPase, T2SS/T4P/T4SS family [Bacillus sp. JCM 19034]
MEDIESYCLSLINEAITKKATDIHIMINSNNCTFFYRSSGVFNKWRELPIRLGERLISHLKYRSGMNLGEQRKPQSMSIIHQQNSLFYSLRLSTLPNKQTEGLVIRILPHHLTYSLSTLALIPQFSIPLTEIPTFQNGLCLFAGSTGSGKTTTLYAIIKELLLNGSKSIISIEDPIEIPINDIVQVEVSEQTGLTFDASLRAALRHDPDVLLIGEIRDEVTAALAIRAALTGHLVLATVHASDMKTTLLRLLNLGVKKSDLLECCKMIIIQQLVRLHCPICFNDGEYTCTCKKPLRKALFDIAKQRELMDLINGHAMRINQMRQQAKKGWALGYINDDELWRCLK